MDTVKIYLCFCACIYRTLLNVYQNEKCFNAHRRGNKIQFLYVKLLDNIRRKEASERMFTAGNTGVSCGKNSPDLKEK